MKLMARNVAIVVAAGKSTRMSGIDKIFHNLGGLPLVCHSIEAFDKCGMFDEIIVVVSDNNVGAATDIFSKRNYKNVRVLGGGIRRQDSVKKGLSVIEPCDYVAIHDGARPFLTYNLLTSGFEAVKKRGAAVPVVKIYDTVKSINEIGIINSTINRNSLRLVQTPQFFEYDLIMRAHEEISEDSSDDSFMVEKLGREVTFFEGDHRNIKVTVQDDIGLMESLIIARGS